MWHRLYWQIVVIIFPSPSLSLHQSHLSAHISHSVVLNKLAIKCIFDCLNASYRINERQGIIGRLLCVTYISNKDIRCVCVKSSNQINGFSGFGNNFIGTNFKNTIFFVNSESIQVSTSDASGDNSHKSNGVTLVDWPINKIWHTQENTENDWALNEDLTHIVRLQKWSDSSFRFCLVRFTQHSHTRTVYRIHTHIYINYLNLSCELI